MLYGFCKVARGLGQGTWIMGYGGWGEISGGRGGRTLPHCEE